MVARIRKLSGIKKVGHGGTLDPNAEGILPILLGQGTRMNGMFDNYAKRYEATILLGTTTNTLDIDGEILSQTDPSDIDIDKIKNNLLQFKGEIEQKPPMFSAVKYNGQRLYNLARQGITVERKSRKVMVYDIWINKLKSPLAEISIICGKGTYIRSICDELGTLLGIGATLHSLRRTEYGPFNQHSSQTIDQLERDFESKTYATIYPLSYLFNNWRRVILTESQQQRVSNGMTIEISDKDIIPATDKITGPIPTTPPDNQISALRPEGELAAILTRKTNNHWHPSKVIPQ
jgi:tRNA pseudouridine55 synthase